MIRARSAATISAGVESTCLVVFDSISAVASPMITGHMWGKSATSLKPLMAFTPWHSDTIAAAALASVGVSASVPRALAPVDTVKTIRTAASNSLSWSVVEEHIFVTFVAY